MIPLLPPAVCSGGGETPARPADPRRVHPSDDDEDHREDLPVAAGTGHEECHQEEARDDEHEVDEGEDGPLRATAEEGGYRSDEGGYGRRRDRDGQGDGQRPAEAVRPELSSVLMLLTMRAMSWCQIPASR